MSMNQNSTSLLSRSVLVLNTNYAPMDICSAKRAICLYYNEKVDILESYKEDVHSPSVTLSLPSIVRLKDFVKHHKMDVILTRRNLLVRDNYECQYCGSKKSPLTMDHVKPKNQGVQIRGRILLPHVNRAIVKKETELQSRQKCHLRKCLGSQIKYIIFSNLSLITKYLGSHIFLWSRFEACFERYSTLRRSPSRKLFWNDVPNDKLPGEERSFLFYS